MSLGYGSFYVFMSAILLVAIGGWAMELLETVVLIPECMSESLVESSRSVESEFLKGELADLYFNKFPK